MSHDKLFIRPPSEAYESVESKDYFGFATYAQYNYLRPGMIARLKLGRFEKALRIAATLGNLGKGFNAIDVGCADGVLLPSLSNHYNHVLAVDASETLMNNASGLVRTLSLTNVDFVLNQTADFDAVEAAISESKKTYRVAFLLETLEHVGDKDDPYISRTRFVRSLLNLLDNDSILIISVPRMVGLSFLAKYAAQAALGLHHEKLTLSQLVACSLFRNTEALEPYWDGGHIGFNEVKMERALRKEFTKVQRWRSLTSVFFCIRKN